MAFDTSKGSGRNAPANAAQSTAEENWKAAGFLNIYLPSAGGGRVKLGAIPLKAKNPREAALAEWLAADPDGRRLNKLLLSLIVEYNVAEQTEANNFALLSEPDDAPAIPAGGTGTEG